MDKKIKSENIKMVIFDVDGVMTDGTLYINEDGEFFKSFNAKDGIAIKLLQCYGLISGVISGKSSKSLLRRCEDLNLDDVIVGCNNKLPRLIELCNKYQLTLNEVAFLGDDILDLPLIENVGLSASPFDAHQLVKDNVDFVCEAKGGNGVVREFVDMLLKNKFSIELPELYTPLLKEIKEDDKNLTYQ